MNFTRQLTLVSGLLLLGLRAQAATCGTASLSTYQALGGTGCTLGAFTLKDFDFAVVATNLGSPLTAGGIGITPLFVPTGSLNLSFTAAFSVTGAEFATYLITYTVDPPPILTGMEDDMLTRTPVAPGIATITTDLCVGAAFTPPPSGNLCTGISTSLSVFHAGTTSDTMESVAFGPTSILGVRHTIDLRGNTTGSASFSGLQNLSLFVPEPATWGLIGFGAVLFALRSRRGIPRIQSLSRAKGL